MSQCSICGFIYAGMGHNANPVNSGRCCGTCNDTKVIPARMAMLLMPSPMRSPSNHDRALWALEACKTFGNLTGQNYAEDLSDIIGDLIANLLHLANENDLDPMGRLAAGMEHFTEEVAEEKEESDEDSDQ